MKIQGVLIYIVLGLVAVSYQNCAAPQADLSGEGALYEDTADVSSENPNDRDSIDKVDTGQIFFPEKTMHVSRSSEVVDVLGVCDQTGSIISWTLRSQEGTLIERGRSECDTGSFEVALEGQWKAACGDMQLKAALGAKASSEVTLISDCVLED